MHLAGDVKIKATDMDTPEYLTERLQMVENQIRWRGIVDPAILRVMRQVPRHRFVPAGIQANAYRDCALPIGWGQTISQPYIIALMTSLLNLRGDENVLEVGTGSGYQAAVLAGLARQVTTLELIPELAEAARQVLRSLSINNVDVVCADGSQGYPQAARYAAILVTAGAPQVPYALFEQLTPDGRMVIPTGERGSQVLELWTQKQGKWQAESVLPVAFVPLRGGAGWSSSEWPGKD